MTKIKVLHISQATGGVQRHIIQLLPRLSRERFEVTGICPPEDLIKGISADKQSFPQAFKNIGTEVHTVVMSREINPAFDLAAFFKIYGFLRKRKFDIVHTHSSKAGFLGRIAARLAGVPVIVHTPHSMAFDNPVMMPIQRSFYMFLEKVAGLFCDKIIAVCKGEKELIAGSGVAPGDKIEVINNGVDPALYDKRVDTSAKRKELGLKDSDKVVALVGRMSVQKAPFDFIKAALAVRKEFSDAVFLLLGDGPLLDAVRKYVAGDRLEGFIKVLGWRNDPGAIIAMCDIFALSSLWEALPYSLLDAMALGKPVVTTDTLGPKEFVEDGRNGFVVPKQRPAALAEAITKLLRMDEADRLRLGQNSINIIKEKADINKAVEKTEGLYERLLSEA